jgi:cyclopropane fatty-acyl-phospholipid synthase-like methyltransferase
MNSKAMEIASVTLAHTYSDEMPEFAINNFAEQIILKCCEIAQARTQNMNNPFDSMVVLDIKEYFGLEANQQYWATRNFNDPEDE